jgi:uncharacterized protein involved in exopolysaccharide biosynthesis/Mrp family chromosome partitioning ATPase
MVVESRKTDLGVDAIVTGITRDSATVDTAAQVIQSREIASRVTRALRLDRDPEFNPSLSPGLASRSRALLGLSPKAPVPMPFDRIVDRVAAGLTVRRVGTSYLINISYRSRDPAKAAKIANSFANSYLDTQFEEKFDLTRGAAGWLEARIQKLQRDVATAEAAVDRYRISKGLLATEGASAPEQAMTDISPQIAQATARLADLEAQLRSSSTAETNSALGSPVIADLKARRANVAQRQASAVRIYGPRHPTTVGMAEELVEIDRETAVEVARIRAGLAAQARAVRQQVVALRAAQDRARAAVSSDNSAAIGLAELERRAEAARTVYAAFLGRAKQASAQEGLEQTDARVVSPATPPTSADSPNKPLNLAIGTMLALFGGLAAVGIASLFDRSVRLPEDIQRRLGVAYLGTLPIVLTPTALGGVDERLRPEAQVLEFPRGQFAESLRGLWAATGPLQRDTGTIASITSALPGEGKTSVTLALGRVLAMAGYRVLCIDGDRHRRLLTQMCGLADAPGLMEALHDAAPALAADRDSSVMILAVGQDLDGQRDIFAGAAFGRVLQEMRAAFDIILIDTPPVLAVAESRVLAGRADFAILIVEWEKTPVQAASTAIAMLDAVGVRIAGAALNKFNSGYGNAAVASYGFGVFSYFDTVAQPARLAGGTAATTDAP